ncbi:MAG: 3-hydroxyacyl-ACP dehydratase, partial [bacterium]
MNSAIGIDLGSRTVKIVKLLNGNIEYSNIFDTGHNPLPAVEKNLGKITADKIIATGYGRNLLKEHFTDHIITEIKACARGAHYFNNRCRTVIDIGGQDSKAIKVQQDGSFIDFEMNDRCAAGTGRFLEVMANVLDFTLEEFGYQALQGDYSVNINSMCTVFAESEVVALITSGENRNRIALGLHESIINRLITLILKINPEDEILFVGGVAMNPCMHHLLQKKLGKTIIIPQQPQIVVAVGAALT